MDNPTDGEASPGDPDTRDGEWSASQGLILQSLTQSHTGDTNNINLKVGLLYKVVFSTIDIELWSQ
jgi:hypothetical protein